jgi:hypothetical protein
MAKSLMADFVVARLMATVLSISKVETLLSELGKKTNLFASFDKHII